MKQIGCICIFLCCLFSLSAQAQLPTALSNASNLRQKTIPVQTPPLLLDSLSIVPGTIKIQGVADTSFSINYIASLLTWRQPPQTDSVLVSYRVLPYRFNTIAQRLNYDSIADATAIIPYTVPASAAGRSLFSFGNLQYNGSFGRGISFGNNQDAVVQSNFNLQLNGMLADSIEIAAAISDNNLPIQPDGTTQQLNEFDQVFLQFKKAGWQLNLGDIDLRQNDLYFLNFYKRLQGVTFRTQNQWTPRLQTSTLVSGSIAKGKFTRNVFQGLEGNQGPYRLSGANNEFFFIVLANTERVFIDGELLQRGEDADYIINYNTAEITFMPRRMITKDSRIQVEFEYADRNYLNANLYANQTVTINNKLKVRIGAFSNNDAKNSPINQPLSADQKQFLFNIGDSVQQALYPNVLADSFSRDKILYERVYVQNGAVLDSFYRYSTDSALARFSLQFADLGAGRGNYVPDFNGANGKVFKYIEPVNGTMQGRFEPVTILVPPKKQQLISVGTEYQVDKNNVLKAELALSNADLNTLSSKNGGDDAGMAARINYTNAAKLGTKWRILSSVDVEHVQARFRPLERLRFVEFSREWGLPLLLQAADETIVKLASGIKKGEQQQLSYQLTTYQRSDGYKGYQNTLLYALRHRNWVVQNNALLTNFTTNTEKGSYLRPVVDVRKTMPQLGGLEMALRFAQERNEVRHLQTDSLSKLSFAFTTYTASLRTGEERKNRYSLTFFTRADQLPEQKQLVRSDRSYNLNLGAEILKSQRHQLLLNATYRQLKVERKDLSLQQPDQTVLGRAEYMVREWKGLLIGNVLYELGTGQEQRRDFTYIEVPAGQGEFTWRDYNDDGVQQLNEFEIAQFRDQARFVRILVPTNDFIKAAFTTLNYNMNLVPKALWSGTNINGFQKFFNRFTVQSSMQWSKKSVAKGAVEANPFKYGILDTALISLNTTYANTLSFNRTSSVWGLDITSFRSHAKALLTYGYESRGQTDLIGKLRWMWSRSITLDVAARKGTTELYTPSFENRNYALALASAEPRLSYIKGTSFRLQGGYKYEQKKNRQEWGGQSSLSHALNLETKYNVLQNSSVTARFVWNNITYADKQAANKANTAIAYTMLDGLLPGQNFLWNIDLTRRLLNNVELNFQYDGRQPAKARTVHTGRASLRALF